MAGARILVVEDDLLIAIDLQILLNDLGYGNVYIAYDLPYAFDMLDTINPDFAFLDVKIGHTTVFPLATELAARKVPFIFSTSYTWATIPEEWQNYPLLPKPYQRDILDAAMQRRNLWASEGRPNTREPSGSD